MQNDNNTNFVNELEKELATCFTENGDVVLVTSGSYCLDLFALVGGMRFNYKDLLPLFVRAFSEDRLCAIKILFYTRDIRSGLGERNTFRILLNYLGNFYPDIARSIIPFVKDYGRFDDLSILLYTNVKNDVVKYYKEMLENDIKNKKEGKPISLLSKWLPSINTSSKSTRKIAKLLSSELGYTDEQYRKMLSFLRKGLIIENNLREKDYTFDYEGVPSQAMLKYMSAFKRNDKERFEDYLSQVTKGEKKINVGTLYPYEIIRPLNTFCGECDEDVKKSANVLWNAIDRTDIKSNTIVVRDGSGSMYMNYFGNITPINVATSLALLFSEQLTGPFKDTFITFSSKPQLIKVKGETLFDKLEFIKTFDDVSNTNISRVYSLILKIALSHKLTNDQMIKHVVIISDMEFDEGVQGVSTFESFKEKFEESGYDFPELIFWNVSARDIHLPVTKNEANVKLCSGASDKIFKMVLSEKSYTPFDFMNESLQKYSFLDDIIKTNN